CKRIGFIPSCKKGRFFSLFLALKLDCNPRCNNSVCCLFARLKVSSGRMGSNSSLSVSSRPDPQDSWELLKPASPVSSAAARSVCLFFIFNIRYFLFSISSPCICDDLCSVLKENV
ncbi:hypothetical protein GOODEAATRI_006567, partial [Goodea atripinnis]